MRPPPKKPTSMHCSQQTQLYPTLSGLHWPNTHIFYDYGEDGTVTLIHVNYVGCQTYTSRHANLAGGSQFFRRANLKFCK
jgi:hypothetical protein